MYILLKSHLRGPTNEVRRVYLKIRDEANEVWYVIDSTEGYPSDNSSIIQGDIILYRDDISKYWEERDSLPAGYTWVSETKAEEVKIANNQEALHLLTRE